MATISGTASDTEFELGTAGEIFMLLVTGMAMERDDIGIFRPGSGIWSLDTNGNYIWEVTDTSTELGLPNDIPVTGDWNGDGKDDIGIFRPSSGIWSLDYEWELCMGSY